MNLFQQLLLLPYGLWIAVGLLITVFLGATLLVINIIYFGLYKSLQSIVLQVGGRAVYNILHGPHLSLRHSGTEYRLSIKTGGQHTLASLVVRGPATLPFKLYVINKSSPHVPLYLTSRGGVEMRTHDSISDQKIFMKSNSIARVESFLNKSGRRDIIKSLLERGYQKLVFEKNRVLIQKWGYKDDDLGKEALTMVIDSLNRFTQENSAPKRA